MTHAHLVAVVGRLSRWRGRITVEAATIIGRLALSGRQAP